MPVLNTIKANLVNIIAQVKEIKFSMKQAWENLNFSLFDRFKYISLGIGVMGIAYTAYN